MMVYKEPLTGFKTLLGVKSFQDTATHQTAFAEQLPT
ncbi:hypothetical protein Barb4_03438 [Bacteroidales bacterium Barb4]|nr:hypothetical protein Barb4_03438 [Bacteroidales bacterium Barb4]